MATKCAVNQPSERCGFNVGRAENKPCYRMSRKIGLTGDHKNMYIRWAALQPVEKFLARLNDCGERIPNKSFCGSQTKAWVWEAYAFRPFVKFENFDKVASPLIISNAISADGIEVWESGLQRKDHLCKYYKDAEIGYELRWQNFSTFTTNQWSETTHSWGVSGTLIPHTISSPNFKSLLDEEGIGIICPFDEIWIGAYWFGLGPDTNHATWFWDVKFRPREITKNDLMMILIKRGCNRPCNQEPTMKEWPCLGKCHIQPQLEEGVNDDTEITLPNGQKVKKKDYLKDAVARGWLPQERCYRVCKDSTNTNAKDTVPPTEDEDAIPSSQQTSAESVPNTDQTTEQEGSLAPEYGSMETTDENPE